MRMMRWLSHANQKDKFITLVFSDLLGILNSSTVKKERWHFNASPSALLLWKE